MTTAIADGPSGGSAGAVRAALGYFALGHLAGIAYLADTTSTNDRVLALPPHESHGWLVLAGAQTKGRGRQGRVWCSAPGTGLYVSIGWVFPHLGGAALGPLSLRAGLAVAEALEPFAPGQIRLKWPNDLWVGSAKLGGLLVETRSCGQGAAVVVGVGVNLDAAPAPELTGGEAAVALATVSPMPLPTREALVAAVVDALVDALAGWRPAASNDWLDRWRVLDALADAPVSWSEAGQAHEGIALGPAEDGSLRVMTLQGERRVASGDVQRMRRLPTAPAA